MEISVIIVNYNVKAYLANCIESVLSSKGDIHYEIIVIDNASVDGSAEYIKQLYPNVSIIINQRNVGFGKANNQGFKMAKGKYVLALNPDTVIHEDTLVTLYEFMESDPSIGISTCKILNADGSFSLDTMRNIPTPISALLRVFGLENKIGSGKHAYFLKNLDTSQVQDIPIISGAFMFLRADLLEKLGGFDERFFMYFEDTDLCLRARKEGYRIVFHPETSVVHYRGESTRKHKIDHHLIFNTSLYQFYKKHYTTGYGFLFRAIITIGIFFRGFLIYGKSLFEKFSLPAFDFFVLNTIIIASFIIRYDIPPQEIISRYKMDYFGINVLISILFLSLSQYYNLYSKEKYSLVALIKTVLFTFSGVAFITFFLRDFAFSRLIIILGSFVASLLLTVPRLISRKKLKTTRVSGSGFKEHRVVIIGYSDNTADLIRKIRSQVDFNYVVVGIITNDLSLNEKVEDVPVLGRIQNTYDLLKMNTIHEVLFMVDGLSHSVILNVMSAIAPLSVTTKIIPRSLDFLLGKTNVSYFGSVPAVTLELAYQKTWNRFIKRTLDITLSSLLLVLLFPWTIRVLLNKKIESIYLFKDENECTELKVYPTAKSSILHFLSLLLYVLKGVISFAGAPLYRNKPRKFAYYKFGITGYRQINEHKAVREEEKELFEEHYFQNYKIWLDIEIVLIALRDYLRKKTDRN